MIALSGGRGCNASFDHAVGAMHNRLRNLKADRARGTQVHDQFELRRLIERQLWRLGGLR